MSEQTAGIFLKHMFASQHKLLNFRHPADLLSDSPAQWRPEGRLPARLHPGQLPLEVSLVVTGAKLEAIPVNAQSLV